MIRNSAWLTYNHPLTWNLKSPVSISKPAFVVDFHGFSNSRFICQKVTIVQNHVFRRVQLKRIESIVGAQLVWYYLFNWLVYVEDTENTWKQWLCHWILIGTIGIFLLVAFASLVRRSRSLFLVTAAAMAAGYVGSKALKKRHSKEKHDLIYLNYFNGDFLPIWALRTSNKIEVKSMAETPSCQASKLRSQLRSQLPSSTPLLPSPPSHSWSCLT